MRNIVKYNSKGAVCGIETSNVVENLHDLGYSKIAADDMLSDSNLVRVSGKFIERCSLDDLKNIVMDMTGGTPAEKTAVIKDKILSRSFINWLNKEDVIAFKDTRDVCHFFFKNGVLKIARDGTEKFCNLDDIEVGKSRIWKTSVLNMEYKGEGRNDYKESVFYQFCRNAVGEDGISYLMRALGYLLHSYKDPSNPKAIIFSEAVQDDSLQANGGTGKSLIATKALSIFRTVSTVDGKAYDPKNRFKFQGIKEEADIAALEDVPYNFKYDDVYNYITGDAEFERKNMTTVIVPYERSPKFIITTNFGIPAHGGSDKRRRCVIGFQNYYSDQFRPFDEFGHNFFSDWKDEREDEWQKFFLFMKECVKLYFKEGIQSYNHTMIENVALRKFFGNELYDYCLMNYALYCGDRNAKTQKDIYEGVPSHIRIQFKSQGEFISKFNRMMKSIGIDNSVYKNDYLEVGGQRYHTRLYVYNIVDPTLLERTIKDMGAVHKSVPAYIKEDEVEYNSGTLAFTEDEIIPEDECPF